MLLMKACADRKHQLINSKAINLIFHHLLSITIESLLPQSLAATLRLKLCFNQLGLYTIIDYLVLVSSNAI
jgi:hypothetical protein